MIINVTPDGIGFDFVVFWEIARTILQGASPYAFPGSFYPPATSYLFTPLGLLPLELSFILFTVLSCAALATTIKKPEHFLWLFFWPVGQVLYSGQNSLLFVPLIPLIHSNNSRLAVLGAALITLKPQIAILILPWFVVRWIANERRKLAHFLLLASALHLWPLLIRPTIFREWFGTIGLGAGHKAIISSGIWLFNQYLPTFILISLSVLLAIFIFFRKEKRSRAALTLASPVTGLQDTVMLMDTAPVWLLVPVSLIGLAWSRLRVSTIPGILIATAAFAYQLWSNRPVSTEKM